MDIKKVFGGKYIVKVESKSEEVSDGGIIVNYNDASDHETGFVIDFDVDASNELDLGDRVLFSKYSGFRYTLDTGVYAVLSLDDVIMTIV